MTRLLGAAVALALIGVLRVSDADAALAVCAAAWTAICLCAVRAVPTLACRPVVWLIDSAVALGFVWLSTDWRSPFYVFALTTLVLPATSLRFRPAVGWGVGFTTAYFALVVALERVGGKTVRRGVRLEIAATHLIVPVVVVLALAYANALLVRLRGQQRETERLAIAAERQRIAWELHDAAKQRVHAAHLVLTAIDGSLADGHRALVDRALSELRAATGEMDTTVGELRSAVDGRPIHQLLRERADALRISASVSINVTGRLPPLPETVAAHVYRIAAEALTNAVRHAKAKSITVLLERDPPRVLVCDDGIGLPSSARPGAHGLRSMRDRAQTIDARLRWTSPTTGGTTVELELPRHYQGDPP